MGRNALKTSNEKYTIFFQVLRARAVKASRGSEGGGRWNEGARSPLKLALRERSWARWRRPRLGTSHPPPSAEPAPLQNLHMAEPAGPSRLPLR